MVPEDQFIAVCGEVLFAELDKGDKGIGIRHGAGARIVHQLQKTSLLDLIDLVFAAADNVVVPAAAASGIDDQVDIVGNLGGSHFLQIRCRHLAAGLEVRAAQIDHDGHDIFAVADDLRTFLAGTGRDIFTQRADSTAVGPGTSGRTG